MKIFLKYILVAAVGVFILYLCFYFLNVVPCATYKPKNVLNFNNEEENLKHDPTSFFDTDNPFRAKNEWWLFLKSLNKYKIYHKKKLAEIKSSRDGGSVRTLTWSCSRVRCTGMGDQLFRIQFFLLLAMMSDRLFLVHWDEKLLKTAKYLLPGEIDWTYYDEGKGICGLEGNCSQYYVHDCTSLWEFGWTKSEYLEFSKELFGSKQHIAVTGKILVFNMYIANTSIVDAGPLINEGMQKIGALQILSQKDNDTIYCKYEPLWYNWMHRLGVHLWVEIPEVNSGHIQVSTSWLYFSHYIFTYLFRFPQGLVKVAEQYQKQLGLYGQDYLSLHMRTGFMRTPEQERFITRYINSGWKFFYHEREWHCFIRHAITLRDKYLGPDKYIYMSTDSDAVREIVDTVYADRNIVYGNFGLVHSANQKSCGAKKGPPSVEGYLSTWLDFYLMGHGKYMVHSYSSYAVNAAFLKPIPQQFHSWVLWNSKMNCLAAHRPGRTYCIC